MHTSRQIKVVSFLLLASFVLQAVVSVIPFDGYSLGVMRIGLAKQGDGVVAGLSISTLVALFCHMCLNTEYCCSSCRTIRFRGIFWL